MSKVHVLPVNDLRPHIEAGEYCHCQPRIDGDIVIHNAYDGREFYEDEGMRRTEWEHRVTTDSGLTGSALAVEDCPYFKLPAHFSFNPEDKEEQAEIEAAETRHRQTCSRCRVSDGLIV